MNDLHVIIPAGGSGTRLWPLSRRSRPKFLLDLTGSGRSMLQDTVDRMAPIAASITIVTGAAHCEAVLEQLPEFGTREDRQLIIEPSPRDSMPAIGLAAYLIRGRYGEDAIVGSFAADHHIGRPDLLRQSVVTAVAAARRGFITTIGITPTGPATAYGYIRPGRGIEGLEGVEFADRFVEKPGEERARTLVADGCLWNAGMFVMSVRTLAGHLMRLHPDLDAALSRVARAWDTPDGPQVRDDLWATCQKIAIDHAIAEPVADEGGVAVVPADIRLAWSDIGDFAAVNDLKGDEGAAVRIAAPGTTVIRSDGSVMTGGPAPTVVLVGVEDVIVVSTGDAVLVTRASSSQQVKAAVDALHRDGRDDLL